MNSVTSASIFLSVRLHAVLKRRCQLSGKSMLKRRVGSAFPAFVGFPVTAFVGSLITPEVGLDVRVSCPVPPRSKAVMTSADRDGGFGACANVLLIESIQQLMG